MMYLKFFLAFFVVALVTAAPATEKVDNLAESQSTSEERLPIPPCVLRGTCIRPH
jgi:hypothetical protein